MRTQSTAELHLKRTRDASRLRIARLMDICWLPHIARWWRRLVPRCTAKYKGPRRPRRPYIFSFLCSSSSPVQRSRPAILLKVKAPCGLRGLKSIYSSSRSTSPSSCYRVLLRLLLRTLSALIGCVPCLHIHLLAMALESVSRLMFVSSSCLNELSASPYLYWSLLRLPHSVVALFVRLPASLLAFSSRSHDTHPCGHCEVSFPPRRECPVLCMFATQNVLALGFLNPSRRLLHVILSSACNLNIFIYHLQSSKVLHITCNPRKSCISHTSGKAARFDLSAPQA